MLAIIRHLASPAFASWRIKKFKKGVAKPGEVCQNFRE